MNAVPLVKSGLAVGALAALFGCSAGQQAVPATSAATALRAPHQARSAHTGALIYALEEYEDSVTGYPITATGNVSPSYTLAGEATKIYEPDGMAIARSGETALSDANNELTLYPPGASGNTPPSATITCGGLPSAPGVPGPMTFDAQGNLYVLFFLGHKAPSDEIEVFTPAQQSGCSYGNAIFGDKTGIAEFGSLAVSRQMVYQASGAAVRAFPVTAAGNVPPSVLIEGPKTGLTSANGISFDGRGRIYVTENNDVRVFRPGAKGNAKPLAVIAGSNTQIPDTQYGEATGLVVSKNGTIYVAVQNDGTSILVFAPGSNGNVAPRQVISGSNTELNFVEVLGLRE
jgi:sugar lactone lactonase YvrE